MIYEHSQFAWTKSPGWTSLGHFPDSDYTAIDQIMCTMCTTCMTYIGPASCKKQPTNEVAGIYIESWGNAGCWGS